MRANTTATKSILEEIKEKTAKCPGLKKIMKCIIEWKPKSKENMASEDKSYWSFREELLIINGFRGERLVIP